MRLLRDCAVLLLVVGGVYFWRHRPVPVRPPVYRGARPDLSMPPPSGSPSTAEPVDSAQYVVPEDAGNSRPHLAGKSRPEREQAFGDKPQILGAPAIDATAGAPSAVLDAENSPWENRLRQPWAIGAVAALFLLLYAFGTRALRKGPGGRGFTHD